jgi:miniconductance mechanosensitive channel
MHDLSKKYLASENIWKQIIGAIIQWRPKYFWTFVLLVIPLSMGVSLIINPNNYNQCLYLVGLNLVVWLTIKVCRRLIDIFSLRNKSTGITWCYVTILLSIGLWIVCFLLLFKVKENSKIAAAFAAVSAIVSLVFQDKIKGVVAFVHLRMHHLLNIGDWIQVPGKGVDGEVKKVTLTSVTINNWDTTTSIIPISMLHAEHFINLQNMMSGKTHGRRMYKSFIIDIGSIHPISQEQKESLKKNVDITQFLPNDEIKEDVSNAHLYRMYLFHYLMNNRHISQQPRLIVRWMEQTEGGMPLQIYAFIIDSSLAAFEWQQSKIIEHIMTSLDWFALRLYQRPSGYDMRNRKGGEK